MNVNDIIMTALKPGSPMNRKGNTWRSIDRLAGFVGLSREATMEILLGDLSDQVEIHAKEGKVIVRAWDANAQAENVAADGGLMAGVLPGPGQAAEEVEG